MIRFATVGTSGITEMFVAACALTGRFEHTAVYSRTRESGEAFARKDGCGRVFTELRELAADDGTDAVYIASPNIFHYEQSRIFLEAGKHVICEKPVTVSCEQYRNLLELADSKGLIYMEAIMSRHSPSRPDVLEALSKTGRITSARLDFCQRSSRYDAFLSGAAVNIFDMSLAAGTLMDLGVYCVYAAVDMFGNPHDIYARTSLLENGADGSGCALFDYGSFQAVLTYGKTGQSSVGSEIIGDNGTLIIGSVSQYAGVKLVCGGEEKLIYGIPERDELMSGEANSFADYIEGLRLSDYRQASVLTADVHTCMDRIKDSAGLKYEHNNGGIL